MRVALNRWVRLEILVQATVSSSRLLTRCRRLAGETFLPAIRLRGREVAASAQCLAVRRTGLKKGFPPDPFQETFRLPCREEPARLRRGPNTQEVSNLKPPLPSDRAKWSLCGARRELWGGNSLRMCLAWADGICFGLASSPCRGVSRAALQPNPPPEASHRRHSGAP